MLHNAIYEGCERAVSWVMMDAHKQGHVGWLERVGQDVRGDNWRLASWSLLWGAIQIWRNKHPEQPLFNHELFDAFDEDLIISLIQDASDKETLLKGVCLHAFAQTTPWLLKATRKENPRRSARLAAKRVTK